MKLIRRAFQQLQLNRLTTPPGRPNGGTSPSSGSTPVNRAFTRQRAGFTLIELLLYMGLLSGFLVLITRIFLSTLEIQTKTVGITRVEQDAEFILQRLQYDIGRADSVVVPASFGATTNSLQLQIDGEDYTYAANDGSLQLTTASSTESMQSSETTTDALLFTLLGQSDGRPSIQVTVTVSSVRPTAAGEKSLTLTSTSGLR